MYLEHFGLREAPFRITPHTEFFFAGANRGATLEALIYAITHDEGIVKVSGEVGSGKTMLCRMLLEKLPDNVETVYLANPMLSRDEILFAVADELRIPLPEGRSQLVLRALQTRLLEIYAAGRQVVALIDEAHAMPPEALEEIRLLSNLESKQHKLLQIVLFAQPELDQRLRQTAMRQLNDRITHSFKLAPLLRSDIAVYLMFRLRAAGYRGPDLFTKRAVQMISKASEGLSRRINILADKALLVAYSQGVHQIGCRQVRAAIRDADFGRISRPRGVWWPWASAALAIIVFSGLAYIAGARNAGSIQVAAPSAAAPASAAMTATEHAPEQPAEPPAAAASTAPAGVSAVALPATSAAASAALAAAAVAQPVTLNERLLATRSWLETAPDSNYFIQLLNVDASSEKEVIDFIARNAAALDLQHVRVYRSTLSGRARLGVIYGDYRSRAQANAALARLEEISPASKPYVRAVSKLR
ncbi:AAA family ATPase [Candidatus Accumulibacter sp. ACC003]|uniref:AAA family ATPase n=1 Tax=Candidatus Accumulibacter sp. ACC003 TaxID=2823334 RepID=UPI0025BA872A|nr:AAA family ATPase [Candidatus Accumulibacter sp. ACC003]